MPNISLDNSKIIPMLKDKNKIKNSPSSLLKGANSDKPSRFVVDLRGELKEAEEAEKKEKKKAKWGEMYEKVSEFDIKEYLKDKKEAVKNKKDNLKVQLKKPISLDKEKVKKTVSSLIKNSQPIDYSQKSFRPSIWQSIRLLLHITGEAKNAHLMYYEKLDRLFVFSILKFFFKLLQKIGGISYNFFYITGWFFVFLARLFYFSIWEIIKLFVWAVKLMVNNLRPLKRDFKIIFFLSLSASKDFIKFIINRHPDKIQAAENEIAEERRKCPPSLTESFREKQDNFVKIQAQLAKELELEKPMKKESKKFKIKDIVPKPGLHLLKPTLIFAAVLFILILPFKAFTYYQSLELDELRVKVLGVSLSAVNTLKSAGEEASGFNFKAADKNFSQSAAKFLEAQNELGAVNDFLFTLASIVPDEDLRLASQSKNILSAGRITASLGGNLSLAVASLFNGEGGDINDIINDFILYGEKAIGDASQLRAVLDSINPDDLPALYKEQFIAMKGKILFLESGLLEFTDLTRDIENFLGMSENKRYLLVFQNNAEMRATGGFIGSYALADFQGGKIKNIEVPGGGSYDTEAGLKDLVAAPEPLRLVNPLWHFWDANWWPDWPRSAKKLAWFYEHSDGPTVDGVIGLTPRVAEKLLQVIGPLDMTEKYGVTITAENFWQTAQDFSERKDTDKSKEIIGDLLAKIIEEFPAKLNRENLAGLAKILQECLDEKHILFYFFDNELENKIAKYGWDGKLRYTDWDYLLVVNTNIAGGKSDRKIRETISHQAEVMADGSIVDTIEVKREHIGEKFQSFFGVRNVDWMRVYVPLGSKLLKADGFQKPDEIYFEKPEASWQRDNDVLREESSAVIHEGSGTKIYEEDGKTVFANWSMVDPGQTAVIRLKYILPFKITAPSSYKLPDKIIEAINSGQEAIAPYALLAQKQSGSEGSIIKSELKLPANMRIIWHYPESANAPGSGWNIEDGLRVDKYWAGIIEIKD